jgi:hypothetical protein
MPGFQAAYKSNHQCVIDPEAIANGLSPTASEKIDLDAIGNDLDCARSSTRCNYVVAQRLRNHNHSICLAQEDAFALAPHFNVLQSAKTSRLIHQWRVNLERVGQTERPSGLQRGAAGK